MKKLVVLGVSAAALLVTAAFADEGDTRLAAADSAVFAKLDTNRDGRVSAIEAANDSKVAQGFTSADADKDGYLTRAEFANLDKAIDRAGPEQQPRSQRASPETSPETMAPK